MSEVILVEDFGVNAAKLATVVRGALIQERIRVISKRGVIHWLDVHAKPFYDEDGSQDGVTATLRLADDQVAAEDEAERARRLQAMADARYRLLMDNSVVPTSLTPSTAGSSWSIRRCDFFGYDADALLHKT